MPHPKNEQEFQPTTPDEQKEEGTEDEVDASDNNQ
jgi:hypothetical protein